MKTPFALSSLLLLLLGVSATHAEPIPAGAAIQINAATAGRQLNPAVESLGDGRMIVVWEHEDGGDRSIAGRFVDAAGQPSGADLAISTQVSGDQVAVDVASHPDSSFIVVWKSDDILESAISSRRFDAGGAPSPVVDPGPSQEDVEVFTPEIADTGAGSFVVTWEAYDSADDDSSIRARFLTPSGAVDGTSFELVSAGTDQFVSVSDALTRQDEGFRLAWRFDGGGVREMRVGDFDAAGGSAAPFIPVTTSQQLDPAFATLEGDGVLAVWGTTLDGLQRRRISAAGVVGPQIDVTASTFSQMNPSVVALPGDRAAIAWHEIKSGQPQRIEVQILGADDNVEAQFTVDEINLSLSRPQLAYHSSRGELAVVWVRRFSPGADQEDLFLRRYLLEGLFADGFESGDFEAWSLR